MKTSLFSIILIAIGFITHAQDCYTKATPAISVSYGYHQKGSVITIEGSSWGIERLTSFGGGFQMYETKKTMTKEGLPVVYTQAVFDVYVKAGIKLNKDQGRFYEGGLQLYHVVSASVSLLKNISFQYTLYGQIGEKVLIGLEPSFQSRTGAGVSARVLLSF